MNFGRCISRFLAIFVIVGLVSQPLVTPAGAKQRPAAEMTGMAAMSADMPCCPDEQKNDGCRECPLAMCMSMIAQVEPLSAGGIDVSFQTSRLSFPLVDLTADGLIGVPPDHPPRILT
jgi:hypothetical protein